MSNTLPITPEKVGAWLAEARANRAKLRACQLHTYVDATPDKTIGKKWRCTSCGGEAGTAEKMGYEQGLEHGRART